MRLLSAIITLLLFSNQVYGEWKTSFSKDEMTGDFSAYAISPDAGSTKTMSFPYSDINAWIGIGCNKKSEWVYIGFNSSPNLQDTETKDGYNLIRTRVKWNDSIEGITMIQDWGGKYLHFTDAETVISKISQSKNILLELNWYGQGKVYFKFSADGSSSALQEIRMQCQNGKMSLEDAKKRLLNTKECVGCNLVGAKLSIANLEDANLEDANLEGANLFGANLNGANLGSANLEGANLFGADLNGANLFNVKLSNANLNGAKLEGANLNGANLEGAKLEGAKLSNANMEDAKLFLANLMGADLRSARLKNTDLSFADLRSADLSNANLSDAKFCRTTMPDGTFNNKDC